MISIELNEINEDWVNYYVKKGKLKNFKKAFNNYTSYSTSSEKKYSELEPWIQWPSFYTGLPYNDHKCFHIGDFYKEKHESIYTSLQNRGLSVLAVSPMNCYFKEDNDSMLLPDPWEEFEPKERGFVSLFYNSVKLFVNTNAGGNVTAKDYFNIFLGFLAYARPLNYFKYLSFLFKSISYKWYKALFLDLLLTDLFIKKYKKGNYNYSSLFLNAGAHIQHHHLYDSACYKGKNINPPIYSKASYTNVDPLFEIYDLYDQIISDLISLDEKFMITTGLQQIGNMNPYCQYRLIDFNKVLGLFNVEYSEVIPRMSRDFTIQFPNRGAFDNALACLNSTTINNQRLFNIDKDESLNELFVKIDWTGNIEAFKNIKFKDKSYDLINDIVLVSVENAIHKSKGWHIRNFDKKSETNINIWDIRKIIELNI